MTDIQRVYFPQMFNSPNMEAAKAVILCGEPSGSITTEERWEKETPYLVEECGKHLNISSDTWVLDYGCGIGRMAKGLIDKYGCHVIGVDFSGPMRDLAPKYVESDNFVVWSPETLGRMIERGVRVDCAIAIWVIQHIFYPSEALKLINGAMKPEALFYTLNSTRAVPSERVEDKACKEFIDDGVSVEHEICKVFQEKERRFGLPAGVASRELSGISVTQILGKKMGYL